MTRRVEKSKNLELFREAVNDFHDLAVGAELSRNDPSEICHGRNIVVWGWSVFSEALEIYSKVMGRKDTFENSGTDEVIKTMMTDHEPDKLLVANAHYLFQKYTFNDLENPGIFLKGLESPHLEKAMAFCLGIFTVGIKKNDLDVQWPIVPLDNDLWSVLSQTDKDFMKTFTNFQATWGGVSGPAIDNFPRTRLLKSEKQFRYLLNRMLDIGLVTQEPLEEDAVYKGSKENFTFFGFK